MTLTDAIPRAVVAEALGLPETTDTLPPGDLPVDRLALRYIAYLASDEAATETPDAWTGAVFDHLVAFFPADALAVLVAGADRDPDGVLVDPLLDLGEAAPDLDLEAAAEGAPGFAALLARAQTA
ncbi:hypothetical protein ACK8OR_08740 [Jannaschia sp. KMU-145]|uniref:hypothetical protein n=1 Tax=Jannaschia halovivens TaxID=3388667 RepID=UPI00396B1588